MSFKQIFLPLLLGTLVISGPVFAQAQEGEDIVVDNGYKVTINQFPQENPQIGRTIFYSYLLEYENSRTVNNVKAWVQISDSSENNQVLFSSSDFQVSDSTVNFEYIFSKMGEYQISVRLIDIKLGEEITVKKIITVEDNPEKVVGDQVEHQSKRRSNFNFAVLTTILGVLGGIILARAVPLKGQGKSSK